MSTSTAVFDQRPPGDRVDPALISAISDLSLPALQTYFADKSETCRPGYLRLFLEKFWFELTVAHLELLVTFEPRLVSDSVAELLVNSALVYLTQVLVQRGWRVTPAFDLYLQSMIRDGLETCEPAETVSAQAHAQRALALLASLPRV